MLQAKKHKPENIYPEESHIHQEIGKSTKEDTLGQKVVFRHCQKQVRDSEERIHGGSLFQREGAQTLKTLVPVLVLHLGADKMGKISKIGWFTRREDLVG